MDKNELKSKIELTQEQGQNVLKFEGALIELMDSGVGLIGDLISEKIYFVNMTDIKTCYSTNESMTKSEMHNSMCINASEISRSSPLPFVCVLNSTLDDDIDVVFIDKKPKKK